MQRTLEGRCIWLFNEWQLKSAKEELGWLAIASL
jgi:hypothetical protein